MSSARRNIFIVGLIAFGLVWLGQWAWRWKPTTVQPADPAERQKSKVPQAGGPHLPAVSGPQSGSGHDSLRPLVEAALTAGTADGRRLPLGDISRWLRGATAPVRQAQLADFMASRRDVDLGGLFRLAPDGSLAASPTLRVWLLNELSGLDPAAAATLAQAVLARPDSADEWAVALRCLALGDTSAEARAVVKERMFALLRHEPWQRQPSSGFLQAFDVAVHLRDREFAPVLSELLRQTNQAAVAHAAYLAMDRLVLAAPVEYLRILQTESAWLEGRETSRAGFFARADATDPAQRVILEQYLLDQRRSAEELNTFAATFPNASQFLSHNLLTRQTIFDGATLARRDAATLAIVRQWLTDPRFADRREPLRVMEARLQEFMRQAKKQSAP